MRTIPYTHLCMYWSLYVQYTVHCRQHLYIHFHCKVETQHLNHSWWIRSFVLPKPKNPRNAAARATRDWPHSGSPAPCRFAAGQSALLTSSERDCVCPGSGWRWELGTSQLCTDRSVFLLLRCRSKSRMTRAGKVSESSDSYFKTICWRRWRALLSRSDALLSPCTVLSHVAFSLCFLLAFDFHSAFSFPFSDDGWCGWTWVGQKTGTMQNETHNGKRGLLLSRILLVLLF